jgi:hypothetical protein
MKKYIDRLQLLNFIDLVLTKARLSVVKIITSKCDE